MDGQEQLLKAVENGGTEEKEKFLLVRCILLVDFLCVTGNFVGLRRHLLSRL